MTVEAKPVSTPRRRFLRFSVRGMIVVVFVLGVLLWWMARVVRTARAQRDAVTAIKKAQGRVAYDWEWSKGQIYSGGKSLGARNGSWISLEKITLVTSPRATYCYYRRDLSVCRNDCPAICLVDPIF